ncbi:MAG: SpoIIE family protein phosphatase, partial [Rhodospirillales bacterium]|nr:SpoIIE family protein phosphatase [Rhodospirillales bacterium]
DSFGELSTIENGPCSASVTAETEMVLLSLGRAAIFEVMARIPDAGSLIAQSLCRCLRDRTAEVTSEATQRNAFEKELQIGRKIQAGFLPASLPQIKGWEIAAHFQAAREVAGDFYDVFTIEGRDRVGLIIGDVCDKGVGAALFMTLFRSLLRASAKFHEFTHADDASAGFWSDNPSSALRDCVRFVNNYIATTHGDASMFATLFFGLLEPDTGHLYYINGGHEQPVLVGAGGIRATLENTGPAVGLFPGAVFTVGEAHMEVGDTLFSYTDGVPDAANGSGEAFSTERLMALLEKNRQSAGPLVAGLMAEIQSHIKDAPQFDDITLLSFTRIPPAGVA